MKTSLTLHLLLIVGIIACISPSITFFLCPFFFLFLLQTVVLTIISCVFFQPRLILHFHGEKKNKKREAKEIRLCQRGAVCVSFAAIFDLFGVTKSPIPSHHRRNKSKPNSANRGWRVWWWLTSWSYTLRHGGFPKFGEISILTSAVLDCLLRITTCKTHSQ